MAPQPTTPVADPAARAAGLGISREAVELFSGCESVDLHIESFLWSRLAGYDLNRRHGRGLLGARLYSQVDLPRFVEAGMSGGVWSIVTNPFRRRRRRGAVLLRNLERLRAAIGAQPDRLAVVADHAGYRQARAAGKAACFLAIQGGNALDGHGELDQLPDGLVSRITVVHMLRSTLGSANSPLLGGGEGLTEAGRRFIRRMNERRIIVDLAHISPRGFWDAVAAHEPGLPLIVSHTGARGVHDMWRNIDDEQIRAVADTGGVVGVVFHSYFLDGSLLGGRAASIVDHMEHIIRVAGEDAVALGSDWDGMIVTPRDMPTVLELPVLVQRMLERGWAEERIRKVLGENYLRVVREVRPGAPVPSRS